MKQRFEIDAETRDALKKLGGLADSIRTITGETNKAEKAATSFGSVFKGTFASGLVQGALGGITRGIAGLGASMIKGAADLENYKTQFEVMLGSAEKGNKMFADLQKFGASTPFETADLAAATQTMLGFGIAGESVMGNLQMLGDVAGGNAEKLKSLTLTFSQIQSAGKLTGGDLLQMIGQGFNPLKYISEQTGKSMSQLKAEMEKGAISADMVTEAFKKATGAGGQFHGMMEKQSKTFDGMISTLKDTVGMMIADVGTKILPIIKTLVDGLTKVFANPKVVDAINSLAAILVEVLTPVLGAIIPVLEAILPPLMEIVRAIGGVLVKAIAVVRPILTAVTDVFAKLAPVLVRLAEVATKVLDALMPLIEAIAGDFVKNIDTIIPILDVLVLTLGLLAPILKELMPWITGVTRAVNLFVVGPVAALVGAIRFIVDNAKAAAGAIASIFGGGDDSGATGKMTGAWTGPAIGLAGNKAIAGAGARSIMMGDKPAAPGAGGDGKTPPPPGGTKKKEKTESKTLAPDAVGAVDWEAFDAAQEERRKAAADAEHERNRESVERWRTAEQEKAQIAVDAAARMRDLRIALMDDEEKQRDAAYQRDLDALQDKFDREQIAEEEFALAKGVLDKNRAKAEDEQRKKVADNAMNVAGDMLADFKTVAGEQSDIAKAIAVAQAGMDTWRAANAAYASAAAIPIIGAVAGPVAAAAAIAAGLANVAKITSTKALAEGGILNRPTFVAGEAGAEVVAPLRALPGLLADTIAKMGPGGRGRSINGRSGESFSGEVLIGVDTFGRGTRGARFRKMARQL